MATDKEAGVEIIAEVITLVITEIMEITQTTIMATTVTALTEVVMAAMIIQATEIMVKITIITILLITKIKIENNKFSCLKKNKVYHSFLHLFFLFYNMKRELTKNHIKKCMKTNNRF